MTLHEWMRNRKVKSWYSIHDGYLRKVGERGFVIVSGSSIIVQGKNTRLSSRGLLKILTLRGLCL